MPRDQKYRNVAGAIGAAPEAQMWARSRPILARSLDSTRVSARRCWSDNSGGMDLPASFREEARVPTPMAQVAMFRLVALGSEARAVSMADLNFSQTLGTPKKRCGRVSGNATASLRGSSRQVVSAPNSIIE